MEIMQMLAFGFPAPSAPIGARPHTPTASTPAEPASEPDAPAAEWTPEALRDFVEWCPAKQLLVLEYLALHPDELVTAWQLREYLVEHHDISGISTERSGRALGAVMAALRKRSAWYDVSKPLFEARWDDRRGENVYRMPEALSEPLLAAARELRPTQLGSST
jgi:hypothetical protein